jgi:hypothetical protein
MNCYVDHEQMFDQRRRCPGVSSVISELDDLEHHLDVANKVSLVGACSEAKSEAMARLARLRNKFAALEAGVFGSFEATREHRAEGHASPVEWLKHHARVKGPAAARARRLAGSLGDLPVAAEALVEGSITAEHVAVLARARDLVGDDVFAELEEGLVEVARRDRFVDFERTVEYWVMRARPRDAADRERQQVEDRNAASVTGPGGVGFVKAQMDPVSFVPWQTELERVIDHLLEVDRAEARDRFGRAPLASELRRTARQRRHDAMVEMARRSAAFGDGDLGPAPVCLNVFADLDLVAKVLERIVEALASGEPFHVDDLAYGPDSLHELEDGTVVTVNTILLAVLTGTVRGVLFDPDGEVLRFGRARRLFTPAQARAIRAKFRRCGHPFGCDRTLRLESDHHQEWDDGGLTDGENGRCLCRTHNPWKTNHKHDPPSDHPDGGQRRRPPNPGPLRQPD